MKSLGHGLYERKWKNGLKLYFSIIENNGIQTILLLGSGKGKEQQKAIKKSYELLDTYHVIKDSIHYTVK